MANYVDLVNQMQDFGDRPYRDFKVGTARLIAIANLPYFITHKDYRTTFIAERRGIRHALGLWAVYGSPEQRGSWWGVVAWLGLLPLLGPVAYARLDMAVAA